MTASKIAASREAVLSENHHWTQKSLGARTLLGTMASTAGRKKPSHRAHEADFPEYLGGERAGFWEANWWGHGGHPQDGIGVFSILFHSGDKWLRLWVKKIPENISRSVV